MRRIIAAVFCILMLMSPCSFAQSISDCKSRSFHGCTAGVNNFPLPNGAWVDYFYTSCQTSQTNTHKHTTANDSGCLQFWFECTDDGYVKTLCNTCTQTFVDITYLCNSCS